MQLWPLRLPDFHSSQQETQAGIFSVALASVEINIDMVEVYLDWTWIPVTPYHLHIHRKIHIAFSKIIEDISPALENWHLWLWHYEQGRYFSKKSVVSVFSHFSSFISKISKCVLFNWAYV